MNYPQLFKFRRGVLGLSVAKMSFLLGISRQALWNVETGAYKPSLDLVEKLADLTGSIEVGSCATRSGRDSESLAKTEIRIEIEK